MARTRLAAALVVPEPHRTEVDGLRRATGGDLGRIPPHITLVPPVNVRDDEVALALALLRDAAAEQPGPLTLRLGPAATFAPANRVVYLEVGGSDAMVAGLAALRRTLLSGPLHRQDHRTFVPHVTLGYDLPEGDDALALSVLGAYAADVVFASVDLLAFDEVDRRWRTCADVVLGPRHVVGRGGLELELTVSTCPDPEVAALHDAACGPDQAAGGRGRSTVVVTARRAGAVVGVASAVVGVGPTGPRGWLRGVGVASEERRRGVGSHLLALVELELSRRGVDRIEAVEPVVPEVAELLIARGWTPSGPATLSTTLSV